MPACIIYVIVAVVLVVVWVLIGAISRAPVAVGCSIVIIIAFFISVRACVGRPVAGGVFVVIGAIVVVAVVGGSALLVYGCECERDWYYCRRCCCPWRC